MSSEYTLHSSSGAGTLAATIRKATFGSYLMSIGGKAGVRMHRDR